MDTEDKNEIQEKVDTQANLMPDFDELLINAHDIESKIKALWMLIYKNAISDRGYAELFLVDLTRSLTGGDPDKHTLHGPQATRYLERIGKSNDQLLKLADQVKAYRAEQGTLSTDELLDQIEEVK